MARKRNPTSWIDFVAFAALCLLGKGYHVTITSSPQSPIPCDYGSVNLTCSISPLPPAPVYYTWTSIYQYWSKPTFVNTTPTATLYVHFHDAPRFPVFYCHVHSGEIMIAQSKITLQLQGYLSYGVYPPLQYDIGNNITLAIMFTEFYQQPSKSIGWFYNDTLVCACSNSRYKLSNESTELIIMSSTLADVGIYEARVTTLDAFGLDDPMCDTLLLEQLQYQAALAPVAFVITATGNGQLSISTAKIPDSELLYFKHNESVEYVTQYGNQQYSFYTEIYNNGSLNQSLLDIGETFHGTNASQLMISITGDDEAGEYYIVSYSDPFSINAFYDYGCSFYIFFVAFELHFHSIYISSMEHITLVETVVPEVMLAANKEVLKLGEELTLVCSALGGIPDLSISWKKNHQYLVNISDIKAVYSSVMDHTTERNVSMFGEYTCVAYNDFYTTQNAILIQEQVAVQSLWTVNIEWWNVLNVSSMVQNTITNEISAVLVQTMDSLCEECDISTDHFTNSTSDVVHSTTHSAMGIYYTSNFTYSSSDGDVTASTLVAQLQQWLLKAEENEVQVDVGEAALVMYKPCDLMNNNPSSKPLCLVSLTGLGIACPSTPSVSPIESSLNSSQTSTPAVVAASFLGGLMAGVICTVIAALCSALLCKRISTQPINNTQTEFEIKDNAAYDQIHVGVQPHPMTCPPPGMVDQQQEENVYEMCANV